MAQFLRGGLVSVDIVYLIAFAGVIAGSSRTDEREVTLLAVRNGYFWLAP
jgi:hypothetical protein